MMTTATVVVGAVTIALLCVSAVAIRRRIRMTPLIRSVRLAMAASVATAVVMLTGETHETIALSVVALILSFACLACIIAMQMLPKRKIDHSA